MIKLHGYSKATHVSIVVSTRTGKCGHFSCVRERWPLASWPTRPAGRGVCEATHELNAWRKVPCEERRKFFFFFYGSTFRKKKRERESLGCVFICHKVEKFFVVIVILRCRGGGKFIL